MVYVTRMQSTSTFDPRRGNAPYYDLSDVPLPDVPFYKTLVSESSRVLELGCGTGRVMIPLAPCVREIVGVDYSPGMIERCREKLQAAQLPESRASAQVADITNLHLEDEFDLVIAPFRVFQALETDAEVAGAFASIRRHLAVNARAVLNVFHPSRDPDRLRQEWCKPNEQICWEKEQPDGTRIVHSEWYAAMDREKLVLYPQLIYRRFRGPELLDEFVQHIKMRCYYPDEFRALVERHGFRITNAWGGYAGEAYGAGKELVLEFGRA